MRGMNVTGANPTAGVRTIHYFGDYELLEEIARGGMGVVFKARQVSLNRTVALKMILAGKLASPALMLRFHTEAEAAANLKHPHIVAIHEVGEHEGQHYFSMDYIEGLSLAERVRHGPMPLKHGARCVQTIAGAIHYAHQRGVLHRDLKPSNILLDAQGQPHVTDFGLAKLVEQESSLTQSEAILGTPSYMAPEQAAGETKQLTIAADIYSLGAILYELLVGQPPFRAATALETIRRVMEEDPVPPSLAGRSRRKEAKNEVGTRNSESGIDRSLLTSAPTETIDRDLETICLKCLRKDPNARYASAEALAEDLSRWQNGEPIQARPVSAAEKFGRWCRRKPALASFAAATVLLLLAVAIGLPVAIYRINREWQRAERGELDARRKAYASDMNLTQQALAQNNLGRALELLNWHRPEVRGERLGERDQDPPEPVKREARDQWLGASGPSSSLISNPSPLPPSSDLRGWEWRYLWQQCQSDALFTLCQKSNPICSLAVSSDGKWVAVGEQDEGRLSIWDWQKKEEVMRFPPDDGPIFVAFSPRERLLAFSSGVAWPSSNGKHRVRFWDGDTKRELAELPLEGPCRGLAFSGDGQTLAALSAGAIRASRPSAEEETGPRHLEGQLTLWNVREGRMLTRHSAGQIRWHFGNPFVVAPDLSVAGYALGEGVIRVVDLRTGHEQWSKQLSDDFVTALAISPDGKTLASGAGHAPSPVQLWEVSSGKPIGSSENHGGYVSALVFSPDGKTLASGSSDQTIRLWSTDGLRPLRTLLGHKGEVGSLAMLPDDKDGKIMVSGCKDGSVLVWDTATSERASSHVRLAENLMTWSFATNRETVLTCDWNGRVTQWQGSHFSEERLFEMGANVAQATFLPHRSLVLARLVDGSIQVWDLHTRSFSRELTRFIDPPSRWLCLAQGNRLIIGGLASETLYEVDLTTWQKVRSWRGPALLYVGALSPVGESCVTLGYGGGSMVIDLLSGRTRMGHFGIREASDATYSNDGKLLAAATHRGFARIWDAATLQPVPDFGGFLQGVNSVAFSPDSHRLVTGSAGKEAIKLWDVESHEELLTLEGQGSMFGPSAFSPDGSVLGSMSGNGVLHLWRAPSWSRIEGAENEAGEWASPGNVRSAVIRETADERVR